MKIKDIVQGLLMAIGLTLLIFLVAAVDSLPMWFLLIVGIFFWIVWLLLIIRERRSSVKLKIMIDGKWVDVDSLTAAQTAQHIYRRPATMQIFDQEETL